MQVADLSIAIVVSRYNEAITSKLLKSAQQRLLEAGMKPSHLTICEVPGAVEIPLVAKLLAAKKKYQAIICLGAVIRGDTDHYQYVCQQVSNGCQQVMLEADIPVIFGVLTTENEEQAFDRTGGKEGDKGVEAADTAILMAKLVKQIALM